MNSYSDFWMGALLHPDGYACSQAIGLDIFHCFAHAENKIFRKTKISQLDFDRNSWKEKRNPSVKLDKFICIQMPCHTSWALFKSCGISNKFNLLLKARCGVFITAHEPAFSVENSNESKAKNVGSCKFKSCDGGASQWAVVLQLHHN